MKFKGKEFLELIRQLKKLRNGKDKTPYKKLMSAICKKFDTSEKTVYREMNKKTPGVRKTRKDAGKSKTKITLKDKAIVKELLDSGEKKTKVRKALEKLTGKKTSTRKFNKIDKSIDKKIFSSKPLNETTFGKNFASFIEKYFQLEFWAEDKEKTVKLKDYVFPLSKLAAKDITLVLINEWNRYAEANGKPLLQIDRLDLSKSKLFNLLDYRLRIAESETDLNTIEQLTDIFKKLSVKVTNLPLDYMVLERILKKFDPTITIDTIISLLKEDGEEQNRKK